MNLNKLLKTFTMLVVMLTLFSSSAFAQLSTVWVDATNGSDSYSGANELNFPALTGPKKSIDAGLAALANGGTLIVRAGTYNESIDINNSNSNLINFTIELRELTGNTDVTLNGTFLFDTDGGNVTITTAGNGEKLIQTGATITLGSNAPVTSTVTMASSAYWTIPTGALITIWNTSTFASAGPSKAAAGNTVGLFYRGVGTLTAGGESNLSTYNAGAISINRSSGTLTLPYAMTLTGPIDITATNAGPVVFSGNISSGTVTLANGNTGNVTFSGNLTLPADADLTNNSTATVTVVGNLGLTASAAGTAGVVTNNNTGSILVSGTTTWTDLNDGADYDAGVVINNAAAASGTISLGPISLIALNGSASNQDFLVSATNAANKTMVLGAVSSPLSTGGTNRNNSGAFSLTNAGTATIGGGLYRATVATGGTITNTGTLTLSGNLTLYDVLTNNTAPSVFNTGSFTVTFPTAALAHLTNLGTITSATGGGFVISAAGVTFNGSAGASTVNFTVATVGATLDFITNEFTFNNMTISNGTVNNLSANATGKGTTTVSGGTLTVEENFTYKTLNYVQTGGTTVIEADGADGDALTGTLEVTGNFTRTAGALAPHGGTAAAPTNNSTLIKFSGASGSQTIDLGPLFQLSNVTFTGAAPKTVVQTIRVSGIATIDPSTTVNFGTVNLVLNTAGAYMLNNGNYTTTEGSGGGVIMGGANLVVYGQDVATDISGNGTYSYITVDAATSVSTVGNNSASNVKFNGVLRLYNGQLNVIAAHDFYPDTTGGKEPKVVRHVEADADGGTTSILTAAGTFNNAANPYDIEYFDTNLALDFDIFAAASIEFANNASVRNLKINTPTTAAAGQLELTASRTITGGLEVVTNADFELQAVTLTANGNSVTHNIYGRVLSTTLASELLLTGNLGTVDGHNTGWIQVLKFNPTSQSHTYNIANLDYLGDPAAADYGLYVNNGTLTLNMYKKTTAPANNPEVTKIALNGGNLQLANDVYIPLVAATNIPFDVIGTADTVDFNDFNVDFFATAKTFQSAAGTKFDATGATTKGYLNLHVNTTLNTNGARLERLLLLDNTVTATLASNSGVDDIFTDYATSGNAGTLALGAFTFQHNGVRWNAQGLYTGTGLVYVTGAVDAYLGVATITVPNLRVHTDTTKVFTLIDNIAGVGVPNLSVTSVFTYTSGKINLNACDLWFNGAVNYAEGLVEAVTVKDDAAGDPGASNDANGELVFNGTAALTYTALVTEFSVPNIRFQTGTFTLAGTGNTLAVTQRFVFGGGSFVAQNGLGNDNVITLSDEIWVERVGVGTISEEPNYLGQATFHYGSTGYAIGAEMPVAPSPVANIVYLNSTGTINASKDIRVKSQLHFWAGNYELSPAATDYTVTVDSGAVVNARNGNLYDDGGNTAAGELNPLLGGPVTLWYTNTIAKNTDQNIYPSTAGFVELLWINGSNTVTLHAARTCGDLLLNVNATATEFDLFGRTLTVSNLNSATLTRGTLISNATSGGVYVYGTLDVVGNLSTTANSVITNVNVNAFTATLAGIFQTLDIDGIGANTLSGTDALMTVDSTVTAVGFTGDLTSINGPATLNGLFTGNLTAGGDVTVTATGSFAAGSNLTFNGDVNQLFTVSAATAPRTFVIPSLTLNKTTQSPSGKVEMPAQANVVTLDVTTLNLFDGVLVTNNHVVDLGHTIQGFNRTAAGNIASHVAGNVKKELQQNDGDPGMVGGVARFEFPVGSYMSEDGKSHYRPFALQFTQDYPVLVPTTVTVNHIDSADGTTKGFPFDGGSGVTIGGTTPYYWLAKSGISLGGSQRFDVELNGTNPMRRYVEDVIDLRVIRRFDGQVSNNQWYLQGAPEAYVAQNFMFLNEPLPDDTLVVTRVVGSTTLSNGSIVPTGTRFTIGLPQRAPVFLARQNSATVAEGDSLEFTYQAEDTDLNAPAPVFSLVNPPANATINATTGAFKFKPDYTQGSATPYLVTVRVTKGNDATLFTDAIDTITVTNVNRAPVLTTVIGDTTIKSSDVLTFTYAATDADAQTLTYTLAYDTAAFAGNVTASITSAGVLTFTPVFAAAGSDFNLTVTVSDGSATDVTVDTVSVTFPRALGDVDGNGVVQAIDASLILQYVVGLITFTPEQMYAADVNMDAVVGALDASWILYYVTNDSEWPAGKLQAAMAEVNFGELKSDSKTGIISLPVKLDNTSGIYSAIVTINLDASMVEFVSLAKNMPEGWLALDSYKDGKLVVALSGITALTSGDLLTVNLKLKDKEAKVSVNGSANLNDAMSTELSAEVREVPSVYALSQNYPNPFNPTTSIKYQIPEAGVVTLQIYNMLGQEVKTLVNAAQEAGYYTVNWDGSNNFGVRVSSGIYIYRIQSGSFVQTMKMNLLK